MQRFCLYEALTPTTVGKINTPHRQKTSFCFVFFAFCIMSSNLTIISGYFYFFIVRGSTTLALHWAHLSVQVAVFCPLCWYLVSVHILQQTVDYCWGQRTRTRTGHKPCAAHCRNASKRTVCNYITWPLDGSKAWQVFVPHSKKSLWSVLMPSHWTPYIFWWGTNTADAITVANMGTIYSQANSTIAGIQWSALDSIWRVSFYYKIDH